ncbi:hypothetical protein ACA30_00490 [Virgibacillus soli]|nr:hypothetical protein ACA30_00490 [Virgibacillus soli]
MNIDREEAKKVLLTGGRAPVTLELARMLAQEGHDVYVADSFAAQLTKSSNCVKQSFFIHSPVHNFERFIADLVDIIKVNQIDQLIPTCEEIFYIAKGKKRLEQYCYVLSSDLPFLLKLHHKYEFIKLVEARGLDTPSSFLAYSKEEMKQHYKELAGEAILKPTYSRFGSQVLYLNERTLANLKIPEGEYIVQKRIFGQPICSYSVFFDGKLVAHTQYKVVYTAGNSAGVQFRHLEHKKVEDWVRKFFEGERVTGQFAFDFIETDTGNLFPLECNPRSTSGIHLFAGLPLASRLIGKDTSLLQPLPQTKRMIALAMLIYGWRKQGKRNWFKALIRSHDVIWNRRDIKPFFYQFYAYYAILKQSIRLGKHPLETTTFDIEWNGEQT